MQPVFDGFCCRAGLGFSFLTENGRFLARVQGPISGNVLLRREQFRRADNLDASAEVARSIITAKVINARRVLQRTLRDHGGKIEGTALEKEIDHLRDCLQRLQQPIDLDWARGIEGEAANGYFGVFNHLILSPEPEFRFTGRSRRPPLDRINCLLSFIYTLLAHDVRSALECVGLDSEVGFCIGIGQEDMGWPLMSWRSSGLSWRIVWPCR